MNLNFIARLRQGSNRNVKIASIAIVKIAGYNAKRSLLNTKEASVKIASQRILCLYLNFTT